MSPVHSPSELAGRCESSSDFLETSRKTFHSGFQSHTKYSRAGLRILPIQAQRPVGDVKSKDMARQPRGDINPG